MAHKDYLVVADTADLGSVDTQDLVDIAAQDIVGIAVRADSLVQADIQALVAILDLVVIQVLADTQAQVVRVGSQGSVGSG